MIGEKYIGLDVHQATISVAVMDSKGKVVMESILETQAATGTARNFVGHFRRRHVGCLALRSAQAACCQVSSVQPAQERAAQTWQQKRQDRCPQTCRSVASQ